MEVSLRFPGANRVSKYMANSEELLSDFNKDGKVDLAVTQNGAETELFINKTKKSGIRVQLEGPDKNKNAIGSSVRLVYEKGNKRPLREIKAGSGYLSQNSSVQVLGTMSENKIKDIEVKWFDGQQQTVDITDDKASYVISYPGNQ